MRSTCAGDTRADARKFDPSVCMYVGELRGRGQPALRSAQDQADAELSVVLPFVTYECFRKPSANDDCAEDAEVFDDVSI